MRHDEEVFDRYTDEDGNDYELRAEVVPYKKGDRCWKGCAFVFGNSTACRKAPTCTPEHKPRRLYGTSLRWFLVRHWMDKKENTA